MKNIDVKEKLFSECWQGKLKGIIPHYAQIITNVAIK